MVRGSFDKKKKKKKETFNFPWAWKTLVIFYRTLKITISNFFVNEQRSVFKVSCSTPALLWYSETRFVCTRLRTYTQLLRSLRRSRTLPIGKHVHFFRLRRTERGTKSDITHQFFPPGAHFGPFFGSFF